MRLSVDHGRCDGCSLCELICSLRRTRSFNPSRSAIRVLKRESRGIYIPIISPFTGLLLDPEGKPILCDLCGGNPKCAEVCPNEAIRVVED
ncbi:hypothetical protein J7L65_01075 [Candidatus Bathyarchaeota archaeon]|nr:hypothetical protein [Candidatus Bathyarchaeota archaeon]